MSAPGFASPATAALLALADQRLPSGGHVHSGGIEQAVTQRWVHDAATLAAFLQRRVRTAGLVAAGLAAAATSVADAGEASLLDAEADARTPAPAHREASRAQGRGLLRTARAAWAAPHAGLAWTDVGARPHHPVVLGCAARACGVDAEGAALVAAYLAVTGPATSAQRLLGLDPVAVAVVTLELSADVADVAREAASCAAGGLRDLPDPGDPLLDVLAQRHALRGDRLFAS
ncbi:MAG: urease accessory UreF family protein [Kineosporiaceae bacterium]